jgi:hypothetical protein
MGTIATIITHTLSKIAYQRKLYSELSRMVISLQARDYIFDFAFASSDSIICLQNNLSFLIAHIAMEEIYQVHNKIGEVWKFIYTVDTCCGYRGILMYEISARDLFIFS